MHFRDKVVLEDSYLHDGHEAETSGWPSRCRLSPVGHLLVTFVKINRRMNA